MDLFKLLFYNAVPHHMYRYPAQFAGLNFLFGNI